MMYVCRAQDPFMSACYEQGLHQCNYCSWYQAGHGKAHYPMPVPLDYSGTFITRLWLTSMSRYMERKVRKWYLTLCFDAKGHYCG